MATLVFIFVGILIGAALVGAFLMGRERGRTKAIDDVARTIGGGLAGRGEARTHAEMAVVGETETNADGSARQDIIAKLRTGEDLELERVHTDATEPSAVRVVSRLGEIGRLKRDDAERLASYLDGGGRVSASIAHIDGGTSANVAFNVVISVVALES
jgi:HIRAN domain